MGRRKGNDRKGVHTDDNGVVIARDHRHPDAWMLRSVPMGKRPDGTDLPAMNIDQDSAHLIMIHLVDNLGLGQAKAPKIRAAAPKDGPDTWMNPCEWVPIATPETKAPSASKAAGDTEVDPEVDLDAVPDVDELDEGQLDALADRMAVRRHRILQAEQLDGVGTDLIEDTSVPEPLRQKEAQLRAKERAESQAELRRQADEALARMQRHLSGGGGDAS
ncbi:hypothetical protein TPB0596_12560 [Tsukamurella pulmonis]|uniref:phage gene 29 protein family protein n=1 Tax=Tsukamurella pulmonis TaxID=47312 RepID=UPI001EE0D6B1|nr:hypothetical protein [Tsukamurella pulmonis]BDD81493.1 hypothetical protein TPB0596_12560 [Tsukamurella pulmonis]